MRPPARLSARRQQHSSRKQFLMGFLSSDFRTAGTNARSIDRAAREKGKEGEDANSSPRDREELLAKSCAPSISSTSVPGDADYADNRR
jgi:hypothetical protein